MPPLLLPLPLLISLPSHSFSCYILLPGYSVRGGGRGPEPRYFSSHASHTICSEFLPIVRYPIVKYHANPRVSLPTTRALGGRKKAGRTETLGTRLQTLFLFSCSSCHLRGVLPLTLSLPISQPPDTHLPHFSQPLCRYTTVIRAQGCMTISTETNIGYSFAPFKTTVLV